VGEAILIDGIAQGMDYMILAEDIVECARAVFSGEDLITHGRECRGECRFVMAEFRK